MINKKSRYDWGDLASHHSHEFKELNSLSSISNYFAGKSVPQIDELKSCIKENLAYNDIDENNSGSEYSQSRKDDTDIPKPQEVEQTANEDDVDLDDRNRIMKEENKAIDMGKIKIFFTKLSDFYKDDYKTIVVIFIDALQRFQKNQIDQLALTSILHALFKNSAMIKDFFQLVFERDCPIQFSSNDDNVKDGQVDDFDDEEEDEEKGGKDHLDTIQMNRKVGLLDKSIVFPTEKSSKLQDKKYSNQSEKASLSDFDARRIYIQEKNYDYMKYENQKKQLNMMSSSGIDSAMVPSKSKVASVGTSTKTYRNMTRDETYEHGIANRHNKSKYDGAPVTSQGVTSEQPSKYSYPSYSYQHGNEYVYPNHTPYYSNPHVPPYMSSPITGHEHYQPFTPYSSASSTSSSYAPSYYPSSTTYIPAVDTTAIYPSQADRRHHHPHHHHPMYSPYPSASYSSHPSIPYSSYTAPHPTIQHTPHYHPTMSSSVLSSTPLPLFSNSRHVTGIQDSHMEQHMDSRLNSRSQNRNSTTLLSGTEPSITEHISKFSQKAASLLNPDLYALFEDELRLLISLCNKQNIAYASKKKECIHQILSDESISHNTPLSRQLFEDLNWIYDQLILPFPPPHTQLQSTSMKCTSSLMMQQSQASPHDTIYRKAANKKEKLTPPIPETAPSLTSKYPMSSSDSKKSTALIPSNRQSIASTTTTTPPLASYTDVMTTSLSPYNTAANPSIPYHNTYTSSLTSQRLEERPGLSHHTSTPDVNPSSHIHNLSEYSNHTSDSKNLKSQQSLSTMVTNHSSSSDRHNMNDSQNNDHRHTTYLKSLDKISINGENVLNNLKDHYDHYLENKGNTSYENAGSDLIRYPSDQNPYYSAQAYIPSHYPPPSNIYYRSDAHSNDNVIMSSPRYQTSSSSSSSYHRTDHKSPLNATTTPKETYAYTHPNLTVPPTESNIQYTKNSKSNKAKSSSKPAYNMSSTVSSNQYLNRPSSRKGRTNKVTVGIQNDLQMQSSHHDKTTTMQTTPTPMSQSHISGYHTMTTSENMSREKEGDI